MGRPLAFFTGSATADNVQRLLANVGWMLNDDTPLHLISSAPEAFRSEARSPYDIFGDGGGSGIRGEWAILRRYLADHEPAAVVQMTRPPIHGSIAGLQAWRADLPFVYRYSGDRFYEYKVASGTKRLTAFGLGNGLGRLPLRLAADCVVLGPTGRRRLVSRGVNPAHVTVLPPSVDRRRFRDPAPPPDSLSVPEEGPFALFVGRLSHLKGLETLRATIPRIIDRRPDVQFILVGDHERPLLFPRNVRDAVTHLGPVQPKHMPALYDMASVLVHPTLTEGVPRVILEALAARTPVVARDVGDIASVTDNTFETDSEFVEMVTAFEELEIDDVAPFSRQELAPAYRAFFGQFK